MYLKSGDLHSSSTASSPLTRILINKDPFTKKIDSIAHYLSYVTLVTYVPVLVSVQGNFWRVSAQTSLNWLLLSLQTFKQKRYCRYHHQDFLPNVYFSFDMIMSTTLKDTWR